MEYQCHIALINSIWEKNIAHYKYQKPGNAAWFPIVKPYLFLSSNCRRKYIVQWDQSIGGNMTLAVMQELAATWSWRWKLEEKCSRRAEKSDTPSIYKRMPWNALQGQNNLPVILCRRKRNQGESKHQSISWDFGRKQSKYLHTNWWKKLKRKREIEAEWISRFDPHRRTFQFMTEFPWHRFQVYLMIIEKKIIMTENNGWK